MNDDFKEAFVESANSSRRELPFLRKYMYQEAPLETPSRNKDEKGKAPGPVLTEQTGSQFGRLI